MGQGREKRPRESWCVGRVGRPTYLLASCTCQWEARSQCPSDAPSEELKVQLPMWYLTQTPLVLASFLSSLLCLPYIHLGSIPYEPFALKGLTLASAESQSQTSL